MPKAPDPTPAPQRDAVLTALAALRVDAGDAESLSAFVEERAALLQQLDGIDAPWTLAQNTLLQAALRAGERALGEAQARRQALARELAAFKEVRRAAKQKLEAAPARWRRTF